MNRQYSWKRTDDIEIDLMELLVSLFGQWKRIAACALAFAVVLGGYGWLKDRNSQNETLQGVKEKTEITEEEEKPALTEAEEQGVADAVRLNNEIQKLETYMDSSVLMQLDPYHKNKSVMLYSIDHAKRQELPQITESYLNFAVNGGAADALAKSDSGREMDKSCLTELISAYPKTYASPYQVVADSTEDTSMKSESLFYIEITGMNASDTEKMAQNIQDVIQEYSKEVKQRAGSHRITLLNRMDSVTADMGLQSQQNEKRSLLSSNKTNLRAMTDVFSEQQMSVYKEAAGTSAQGETDLREHGSDEAVSAGRSGAGIKYMLFGLIAGVFIYCGIFSCWYIFGDTVKTAEEMKEIYTFPVYGGILPESREGKKSRGVPGQKHGTYGCTQDQAMQRIRLLCQNQGVSKLYAAADFPLDELEKKCLRNMSDQLKDQEINMEVAENVSTDTSMWDRLTETKNVLMVCRIGKTTHRMIDDAMNFYLENGMTVAGAVVFIQNNKNLSCL